MAKDAQKKAPDLGSQLATYNADFLKGLDAVLRKRSKTGGADTERRRLELGQAGLTLDALAQRILTEKLTPEALTNLLTLTSVIGMAGMVKGQELIVDCLTIRERVKIKGKDEYGYRRFTIAEFIQHMTIGMEGEDGLNESFEQCLNMLNDIGVALNAFKDENGVPKPDKYFEPETPGTEVVNEADEADVVPETETENKGNADAVWDKANKS